MCGSGNAAPLGANTSMCESDDYAWLTGELAAIARRHAKGRIISALEGGYDLEALGECAATHVRALMDA